MQLAIDSEINKSRQHYIRLKMPESYRELIACGIEKDYSLGFPEMPGFRAGCCHPWYWYDLQQEKQTTLLLIPFIAMDRSYLDYLKYNPQESLESIKRLFDLCKMYGGHFHLIWHNSSFDFDDEWKNWQQVLPQFLSYVSLKSK